MPTKKMTSKSKDTTIKKIKKGDKKGKKKK